MKGQYQNFIKHSKTLEDHHHRMRVACTGLEQVRGWQKHIKERPDGLYEKFIKHSKTLEDHHHQMRVACAPLEQVRGWQKHIKERPDGLRILDKLELKKIEVCIETWEAMCDSVEAVVNAGQKVCENRQSDSKNLLTYAITYFITLVVVIQ